MALSQHQGHKPDPLAFFSCQWIRLNNDINTYQYHFNVINGRGDTNIELPQSTIADWGKDTVEDSVFDERFIKLI